MDFLKTLLAYMAATMIMAVESTATPSVTPVPTPSPTPEAGTTAIVEMTATPAAEVTATPTATVSVTPVPVPTITPNTKAYHNLAQGDKGDEVRKLQDRLIELGYLPEGAADGAYGNQTRTAVRRFQYYNSLTVDGIAGRATQTNLFENPDVMPYPNQETPTPEVTETPATTEPSTVPDTAAPGDGAEDTPAATENIPATDTPEPTVTPIVVSTPTTAPEITEAAADGEAQEITEAAADVETPEAQAETAEIAEAAATEETEAANVNTDEAEVAIAASAASEDTAAPAAAETPAPTEEEVEDVDLDELEATAVPEITAEPTPEPTPIPFEDLAGWVVLNDSGESMQWTELEDGVPVVRSPRMQRYEEDLRVSLDDLTKSVDSWVLTDEGDSLILEAQGFTLALLNEDAGFVSTVDGLEMFTEFGDFDFGEGHYIRVGFLTRALDGSWEWDQEEETLMLRIPEKDPAQYSD